MDAATNKATHLFYLEMRTFLTQPHSHSTHLISTQHHTHLPLQVYLSLQQSPHFITMSNTLPPVLLSLFFATPFEFQPNLLRCHDCNTFLCNVSRLPDEIGFRLSCPHCQPPVYKYYCPHHQYLAKNSHAYSNHKYRLHRTTNEAEPISRNETSDESINIAQDDSDTELPPSEIFVDTQSTNAAPWDWRQVPSFETATEPSLADFFERGEGKDTPISLQEFIFNELKSPGSGYKRLVASAFTEGNHDYIAEEGLPSLDEVYFHLLMSSFLEQLTHKQRETFGELLSMIVPNAISIGKWGRSPLFSTGVTRLPSNLKDLQKFYLKRKMSIFQILPRPAVVRAGSTFSFCSIRDAVQHFLAFSPDLVDFYNANSFPAYHQATMSLLKEIAPPVRPRVLLFDEWKDKFEGATTKKNRSGVHATTITFQGPPGSGHDPRYTYTISIGSGTKGNPRSMDHKLAQSYKDTVNRITHFYDGHCRKVIPVLLIPRSAIQDRVERDAFNSVLSHSSPLTRRWGWVSGAQLKLLLPCPNCHRRRVQQLLGSTPNTPLPDCADCCDLQFERMVSRHCSPILADYPTTCCTCRECPPFPLFRSVPSPLTYIVPVQFDHNFLKQAVAVAYHHRVKSVWSARQTAAYLKLCGVNMGVVKSLESTVRKVHDRFISSANGLINLIPPAWDRPIPIDRYTEAPMHCLKGLGENVLDFVSLWLKRHAKNKHVMNLVNRHLIAIQRLQLSWLRILPFGGKDEMSTGGWVSENYIDLARIILTVFSTVLENEASLNEQTKSQVPIVLRFLNTFGTLVGTALSPDDHYLRPHQYVDNLEKVVKVFIAEFDALEQAVYSIPAPRNSDQDQTTDSKKKDPSWVHKGNVISLLNFSRSASMFGSLTNAWDGDREVFVGNLKPFLNNVRSHSDSFFVRKHTQINRLQALVSMLRQLRLISRAPGVRQQTTRYNNIRRYNSIGAVGFGLERRYVSGGRIGSAMFILVKARGNPLCRYPVVCELINNDHPYFTLHKLSLGDPIISDQGTLQQAIPICLMPVPIGGVVYYQEISLTWQMNGNAYSLQPGLFNDEDFQRSNQVLTPTDFEEGDSDEESDMDGDDFSDEADTEIMNATMNDADSVSEDDADIAVGLLTGEFI